MHGIEGLQKTILENFGLVDVVAANQMIGAAPDIIGLNHGTGGDLALHAETPFMGCGRFEVGVDHGNVVRRERSGLPQIGRLDGRRG